MTPVLEGSRECSSAMDEWFKLLQESPLKVLAEVFLT